MCVGYVPVHLGLSVLTVDDTENPSKNLVFLETTLSQHVLSYEDSMGHRGRNTSISSLGC